MPGGPRPGGRLSPGGQQFRGDDGSADARVAAALTAYAAGKGSESDALTVLASARFLVPVVAVLTGVGEHGGEKDSEMALPTLIGNDGRAAIIAFTSVDALKRWRPDARPIPAEASRVWRAAVTEASAVVVDVAGPVPLVIEGARLAALAAGRPVPAPHEDPDIQAVIAAVIAAEPEITGARLAPGSQGSASVGPDPAPVSDLAVQFLVSSDGGWEAPIRRAAAAISARLVTRLRRGIEIGVTRIRST